MKADEVSLYALRGGLKKQSVCYTHFRSNKIPQMETVMQGTTRFGMQTLIESLAKFYKTGQISYGTALEYSNDRTETEKKLLLSI